MNVKKKKMLIIVSFLCVILIMTTLVEAAERKIRVGYSMPQLNNLSVLLPV